MTWFLNDLHTETQRKEPPFLPCHEGFKVDVQVELVERKFQSMTVKRLFSYKVYDSEKRVSSFIMSVLYVVGRVTTSFKTLSGLFRTVEKRSVDPVIFD